MSFLLNRPKKHRSKPNFSTTVDSGPDDNNGRCRRSLFGVTQSTASETLATPRALADLLDRHEYLPDDRIATACFLALRMRRPLFLEGEAGVGKTSLARTLA